MGEPFVIVGGGLAGAKAAQALREEGFADRIVLVCAETEPPYERPPLSKGYLAGTADRATADVHDPTWYDEHSVELLLGRSVTALDRGAHRVELDDDSRLPYARLLLATGAQPRTLTVPGADLPGVRHLRSVDDATRLRDAIRGGARVVVIGAGWIGLETAATARGYGCEVTVLEPRPVPLQAALGAELGAWFAQQHRDHGVDLRLGHGAAAVTGNGHVEGVVTDDGAHVPADVVVVGIGVRPRTDLAERSGLAVDDGVLVDEHLRTDDPDVFAAGDVANAVHPFYGTRVRVEHWANALHSGPVAARSMLGLDAVHDRLPYFFTDQYEIGMEFTGLLPAGGYDRLVTRGAVDSGAFHAFWLVGDRVVAGMHVNRWDDGIGPVQDLVRAGGPVDPRQLADPSVPLATR